MAESQPPDWDDPDRADKALERLLARVRSDRPVRTTPTPHELRVLLCVSHGMTNQMVAETVGCGIESVKSHLKNAQHRLAAKNRAHAVAIALREGMIV